MSSVGKGGRGKLAPYTSVHYRIPSPIKPIVQKLADAYRLLATNKNWSQADKLLKHISSIIVSMLENSEIDLSNYKKEKEIEKLQTDLTAAQELINQLHAERERQVKILIPALKIPASKGGGIKEAIKQAFPELREK